MQTFADLAERTHLLWLQRLSLASSDYITLSQLQQHDYRLLQSVRLCQRYLGNSDPELPDWLRTLLDNSAAELDTLLTLAVPLSAQALLAAMWLALQQQPTTHYVQQYRRAEQSQLLCLLANKAVAAKLYQTMQALDLRSAVQLAGNYGLLDQRAVLQQLADDQHQNAAIQAELHYSLYLLGQKSDESQLVQQLQKADCLTPRQLQLLLLAAPAERKVQIVNALCLTDITLAINAMGFSGQSKFMPLLLELSKQPAHQGAAQSALITMLGSLTADIAQREPQAAGMPMPVSEQHLVAGTAVTELNLTETWANGNQYQRFAAAAMLVLKQPGLALAEPNNWQGGIWPVA
ncbi:hypothetical protein SAMN06297280_0508 [Arsukibacterium tuosuense]|uniref:TIGR02270 family protein n=2 Tax=Arsukibacterium tuosuense TaxID=1323745 RepID=A0A285I4Q1_9GAMM|nr:hypothetical protein SAMN06297280_0508 [Arsukibacterium tuosuense]